MTRPIMAQIIHSLAFLGSLPDAAAKMYMIQETINAIVTMVQIKNVADKTISWTNNPTEVGSHSFLTLFLMPRAS